MIYRIAEYSYKNQLMILQKMLAFPLSKHKV